MEPWRDRYEISCSPSSSFSCLESLADSFSFLRLWVFKGESSFMSSFEREKIDEEL